VDETADGIDPADLEVVLRVLAQLDDLDVEHPDAVAVRRATAAIFKTVKERRRAQRRDAVKAADAAVTAATATAAPGRIDDETHGRPLSAARNGSGNGRATAGTLIRSRACYVCKQRYHEVDAFYHQLCPACAATNHARREARTDLTGRRALLTGGRAKIGMYIALRLLRDGADTTITTRFPRDATRRFAAIADSADWLHRLHIVGIDLRDPGQVIALADSVAAAGPLDVLINNAAQTVRRPESSYALLAAAESAPLPAGPRPDMVSFGRSGDAHPAGVQELTGEHPAVDAGGLLPDLANTNSWVQGVSEVDERELLEVQLCNVTAPFILVSRLRAALAASPAARSYVVNVSAMEGQLNRGYKGAGHPHTNMAKAALNMLTRTSAHELRAEGILMTAVDTGWITDERPQPTRARLAQDGFHAPLDLIDGAARVYDPIVRGEAGEDLYGCFLKDYEPAPW
jgi:NAD(P)-dependent dehydrogenase (short-subunit alcohol dehydrogenase family)